jgi:hypothetical protein
VQIGIVGLHPAVLLHRRPGETVASGVDNLPGQRQQQSDRQPVVPELSGEPVENLERSSLRPVECPEQGRSDDRNSYEHADLIAQEEQHDQDELRDKQGIERAPEHVESCRQVPSSHGGVPGQPDQHPDGQPGCQAGYLNSSPP